MEQKTEASQAVDARAEQVSRLLTVGGMMSNVMFNLAQRDNPDAKQFKELCAKWDAAAHDALDLRAALKAQPAPTEAAQDDRVKVAGTALLEAGRDFWDSAKRSGQYGAVQWVEGTDGEFALYTRGEYREVLLANIPTFGPPRAFGAEAQGKGSSRMDAQVTAAARVLANRSADNCGVNRDDNWKVYSQDFIDDARAALDAARASAETGGVKS